MIITVLIPVVLCLGIVFLSGAYLPKQYLAPWSRDYAGKFKDPRMKVLAHGLLAANSHNMQPWLIKLDPQDSMSFWLFVDPDRLTPEIDPFARQIIISQGTFLEYVRIAGEHLGYRTAIVLFPEGEIDQAASPASLQAKPVARVTLHRSEPASSPLYDAMFKPDTWRVPYDPAGLTGDQIRQLQALNTFTGITLDIFQDQVHLEQLHSLVIKGSEIENSLPAAVESAQKLFRPNEYQKNRYLYGFSLEGGGTSGPVMYFMEALLTAVPSMNSPAAARKITLDQTRQAAASTPAYTLIITRDNSRTTQVRTGMLYSRFQLAAQTMGFAMQPMSQVLEEFPGMREQYQAVHKDYAPAGGTIQMLIRVGKPVKQVPRTMRRDVKDIIWNDTSR